MSNKSFVHLHVHADGSKLDGLAQVKKLVPAVEALGMPAIAITDHGSMSATYDLHKATKDSVVKPIYGIEAYVAPESRTLKEPVFWNEGGGNDVSGKGAYTHMTLLASTDEGLHNLFHLSSQAYLDGFYRHPRMDDELLAQYGKGIIATTGCPSGAVQTWLRIGNYDKALEAAAKYRDIFGKENYFVELMDHGLGIEKEVIPQLMSIAKDLGLGTVATNDTHYVHKDDSAVHDALLCIGSGSKLQEKDRFSFEGSEFYIKSPEEMRSIWDDYAPDACDNTLLIAERCTAAFGDGKDLMPEFPVPEGETESTLLDKEVKRGLESRYPNGIPEDRLKQAEYEVGIINQMGFPGYFLVTADFINWAKEQGIRVGPGRGCLSKDSNILTPLGFKKISDVKVGDEVYDEKGSVVKVPAVFEYDCDEPLIEIKGFYGGNGNKMTADHKVLVSKARRVTNKQKLAQGRSFEPDYAEPIWMRADEVEVGDLVVTPKLLVEENIEGWEYEQISVSVPNSKYEHSIRNSIKDTDIARSVLSKYYQDPSNASSVTGLKTKEYFETHELDLNSELSMRQSAVIAQSDYVYADYDFGMLLGIFISGGWLIRNGRDSVGFAQRTSEDELLIPNLIQKVFGLTASSAPNKQKDVTSYTINHKGVAQLFRNIFPDYAFTSQTKYIPEELFQTSESFRRGLLEGLWYGDGSHEENESKYVTASRQLAHGVFQLLGTLGLPAGIKSSKRTHKHLGRESERVEHSVVTAHNFDTSALIMGKPFDGKFTYYRVREINIVPPEGKVYDFTVPTTNSYVTDSYVVHNSAAGSIVAYAMGITDIDPMKHGLMFERFLNPERVSMPDIDVDFDDRRRGEVIQYVIDKYGEDKVANIATFGTIKAKAAVKDAARVLSMPYMLGDKLTKAYPQPIVGRDLSLKDAYDPSNERYDDAKEFRQLVENDPDAKETVELAKGLEGVRRGFGMHAAGVIMSRRPLVETVPLMRRDTNSPLMTQFEYPTCEYLGLLKMDFLGLSNLGTIDEALRLIKQNKGVEVNLDAISETLDDKKTYEMVARGETLGVFQLDSPPMRSLLETMVPDSFEDISAVLALYRPGPMGAGSHIEYAERKNGRRPITPIHPELEAVLEPILGETYGLCVTGETLIWDAKSGKRVRIDSIKDSVENGEFYTFGVNEEGVTSAALVSHFIPTGVKKVLQISTRSGHSIRLSEDHPMLTPRGWVNAGELIPGVDRLAVPSSQFNVDNNATTPEEARFLGYMLGDGYINLGQNNFTNKDFGLLEKVSDLAISIFQDIYPVVRDRRNSQSPSGKNYTSRVDFMASPEGAGRGKGPKNGVYKNLSINNWFRELGFEGKTLSADKFIPEAVFASSNEAIMELLAGLWDSDGSVNKKSATLKTISQRLSKDVQYALSRLGILGTIYLSESTNAAVGTHTAYQVSVSDPKFWDLIVPRLVSQHKREGRPPVYSRAQITRGINGSLMLKTLNKMVREDTSLPVGARNRIINNGEISIKAGTNYIGRMQGLSTSTVPSLRKDGSYLPMNEVSKLYLENYGSSEDFFYANQNWTIIDEIKEDGFDEMYDITVEGIHNFLASGLVAHNCIYQEQVMAIAQQLAGYTLGQADLLRRAMGKKDPAVLAKEFIPFKDGMVKNGYSEESIQALWDILVPFSDYAFNRAHTAGYGLVSYWTAYLKANYPAEYMAALLTTNSDNKDKLALYLAECRYQQIEVLPPDINESELNYTAVGDSIRVGLIGVKNLGEKAIKAWIEEREKNGPAKNFTNFLERATTGIGTKRVVESIIKAGVFDSFPENRASLFAVVDDAIAAAKKNKKLKEKSADSLFDADEFALKLDIPELPEWEKMELLAMEREVLGLYVSDHPLADYQSAIESLSSTSIADLKQRDNPPQGQLKLAALVTNIDRKTTRKAGDPWALVTVEDMDASLNLYVFPKTYADARELLEVDKILLFTGKVEKRDDGSTNFIVQSVSTPDMQAVSRKVNRREERLERGDLTPEEAAALASAPTIKDDGLDSPVVIYTREAQLTLTLVERLKDAIIEYQGSRPVHIEVARADHSKALYVLGDEFKVVGAAQFAAEVRSLFGPDAI